MNTVRIIRGIEDFAKKSTKDFDSGHDWWHLHRVRNTALHLQESENSGDRLIIEISALLHDIDDKKFRKNGRPGADIIISELLDSLGVKGSIITEVIQINKYISFSSDAKIEIRSPEFLIVQDADRLDAIGAIGIARAFNYGGFRNNAIYIPETEGYGIIPSTIGHFYDKLLLLSGMMNTSGGRKMAEERHIFLERYLEQFYREWNPG
ncbi:MAG: phosphohydrolase, partial [Odoribacter sp.]|nr:phosphohydrolase [Odoribacter sp.]